MNLMKIGISKFIFLLSAFLLFVQTVRSQDNDAHYERVSLCQFMVSYPQKVYYRELEQEYKSIPISNNINNHNLGANFIKFASEDLSARDRIDHFLADAQVAKKLVAKWFSRNKKTGCFEMSLIRQRGYYNATMTDVRLAKGMARGEAYISDGGERLLNYTFVAIHDFIPDETEFTKSYGFNNPVDVTDDDIINLNDSATLSKYNSQFHSRESLRNSYEIKCATYLYRLVWNNETADKFYSAMYSEVPDVQKLNAFNADTSTFRLIYIGCSEQVYKQERDKRIKSNEALVKTAMARIMDMNLASLQDICPDFRVKASLLCDGRKLRAEIGLKENVCEKDVFEVLERTEDEQGNIRYNVIGLVKPAKGKIWDNRFNAYDSSGKDGKGLTYTQFNKISGGDFYDGLVIRKKSCEIQN